MNIMPVQELIDRVTEICKKNGVVRLDLFGSFVTDTATDRSDIDFIVYGCNDILKLEAVLEALLSKMIVVALASIFFAEISYS